MKVSKKLLNESIIYLKKYLKKNFYTLSKAKRKAIRNLIRKRIRENSRMSEEILDSTLFRLAKIRLRQENKSLLIVRNGKIFQRYADKMMEILNKGGKGLIKIIREEAK